ncbi:MAG: AAA family ATPase [Gammaproteobacteria bacterium]|nr:AAA family ATPase [Gammaproteobacteria bacterium]
MYLEHFGLEEPPFRLSPDPHFLFLSKHHARAKAYLESTVVLEDGFVIITGEVGSGKTTLIKCFMEALGDDVIYAHIAQTLITPVQFLQGVLADFGFKPFKMRKAELLDTLNHFLVEQYSAGKKVLLIVDEAQNLSRNVLEEIRLLSGIETTKDKVLRIILAGQPELNVILDSENMRQLVQRARLRFHLGPMSKTESSDYVAHRLKLAGAGDRQIFEDETLPVIFRFSGGIPRLVNTLCDTAMLCAFAEDRQNVTLQDVNAAVEELGLVEYASATNSFAVMARPLEEEEDLDITVATLLVKDDETGQETLFKLHRGRVILGRTSDNDIQLDSKFISRHHAQIISTNKKSYVEDLNSTNGIFMESRQIKRRVLDNGDQISMGRHRLTYCEGRDQE